MSDDKFVYVTYIASTLDKVFNALLDSELSRQYWKHENLPDPKWEQGAQWKHVGLDGKVKLVGQVLEFTPPRRLVLSWIAPERVDDESRHTRVALDLEMFNDMVRLTVTHDHLYEEMRRGISGGWPIVLSSLKSFLETGKPLDILAK